LLGEVCPLDEFKRHRNIIAPFSNALLCFFQQGVFASKNIFQNSLHKFGSFAFPTVVVVKGETITRPRGRERG